MFIKLHFARALLVYLLFMSIQVAIFVHYSEELKVWWKCKTVACVYQQTINL